MSKQNEAFLKKEAIIIEINNALDSLSNDYEDGKKFIYPGKEGIWDDKYKLLKDSLLRLHCGVKLSNRKERKEYEDFTEGTYLSLLLFHRIVEIMKLLHEGDTRKIKETIDSLEWPKNSKPRTLRQILRLSKKGPEFFKAINGDSLDENDSFFLSETININSLLDQGISYEEAKDKVFRVKDIVITEPGKVSFKGTVVIDEDGKSFFGVGQDEHVREYTDCSVLTGDNITCITVYDSITKGNVKYLYIDDSIRKVDSTGEHPAEVSLTPSTNNSLNYIKTIKAKYDCFKSGKKYQGSKEQHRLLKDINRK